MPSERIQRRIEALRRPISFYGSTRSYHGVFCAPGLESLGMQLHELSLRGEWDEMLRAVTFEVAAEMANACIYDELPKFAREHFDYAGRISIASSRDGRCSSYAGSSELNASAAAPSEERVQWLIKELRDT